MSIVKAAALPFLAAVTLTAGACNAAPENKQAPATAEQKPATELVTLTAAG